MTSDELLSYEELASMLASLDAIERLRNRRACYQRPKSDAFR